MGATENKGNGLDQHAPHNSPSLQLSMEQVGGKPLTPGLFLGREKFDAHVQYSSFLVGLPEGLVSVLPDSEC